MYANVSRETVYGCCAEIASSSPPAEPSAQQFAKRPPEGEKLIKPPAQVTFLLCFIYLFERSDRLILLHNTHDDNYKHKWRYDS